MTTYRILIEMSKKSAPVGPVGRTSDNNPDSKVHGAIMGPIWGRQDPGRPHVGPMKFAIWEVIACSGNGLLSDGIKPLPESMLINIRRHIMCFDCQVYHSIQINSEQYLYSLHIQFEKIIQWRKRDILILVSTGCNEWASYGIVH